MNKLDEFDKLLQDKAHRERLKLSDNLDNKINDILINLPDKKPRRRAAARITLAVALVAVLSITSVFAYSSPKVASIVDHVISYFNNVSDPRYFSDKASFEKFNNTVGVSAEDKSIKLTVDNIAVDDNFINVFYTIESEDPIEMNFKDESNLFKAVLSTPFLHFKINGKKIEFGNHNDNDAYFVGDKVLKAMKRFNISQAELPQNFDLEISTDEIFRTKGIWNIETTIDKSLSSAETKTIKPDKTVKIDTGAATHKITIDRVSISPFGNQIVISENVKKDNVFDTFVLFDDKGNILDVLNTDLRSGGIGKSTNSFEFLKGNLEMKSIKLVPIKFTEDGEVSYIKENINNLPIVFKTVNTGSRVIDNIQFEQNVIKISYHNDGVLLWDPTFFFYDSEGKELDFGGRGVSTSIDRQNAKYTLIYTVENQNPDFSKIAQIGTFTGVQHIELLNDQAITINF